MEGQLRWISSWSSHHLRLGSEPRVKARLEPGSPGIPPAPNLDFLEHQMSGGTAEMEQQAVSRVPEPAGRMGWTFAISYQSQALQASFRVR